ncbi:hypothetical protein MUN82_04935 [Hymenobacter aerilatus]|uniref:Lipoprotein n=1 Tax=Hymenobacter aerilatus TaxID=2932251 RepID=A0A8T9SYH6_9BACT|nr:hypothetical protein [Hymenobacter aerilatus]UOR06441.1 hypothetical protein MUN82_04935 [Hymenobacter aerilatus]
MSPRLTPICASLRSRRLAWSLLAVASVVGCTHQPDAATPLATRPTLAPLATATYAGEYRWGRPEADESGGILIVYPESDSTVLFQVDANDGPPAYHLVSVMGRATLRHDTAYYFVKAPGDEQGCQLRLAFAPTAATVISVRGYTEDCLFGSSFTPDETYRRVSRQVPTYVLDSAGDTLRFAQLPPEQLQYAQHLTRR